jgi:carbonic anhydrase/acetyltransferase-like protein (isoleucine patch superfamily)
MSVMPEPLILPIRGRAPQLHAESWVAPNASVIGQVTLAARASVWYGATLRAETEPIEIGFGTNIQDGVTTMSTRSSRSALARASVSVTTPCCTAVSSRTTHSSGWAR